MAAKLVLLSITGQISRFREFGMKFADPASVSSRKRLLIPTGIGKIHIMQGLVEEKVPHIRRPVEKAGAVSGMSKSLAAID